MLTRLDVLVCVAVALLGAYAIIVTVAYVSATRMPPDVQCIRYEADGTWQGTICKRWR